jgi:hypothetical protein
MLNFLTKIKASMKIGSWINLSIIAGFVVVLGMNYGLLADRIYVAKANWNGSDLDKFTGEEQVVAKNYPGAFLGLREENSFLASELNFLNSPGNSLNCLDPFEFEDPGQRLKIQDEVRGNNLVIEVSGYLDKCILTKQDVGYATLPIKPGLNLDFKHKLTDFKNLTVNEVADCQAYRKNGTNYVTIGLRLVSGTTNHYENEFKTKCELANLPGGIYHLQYNYSRLRHRTLEIK